MFKKMLIATVISGLALTSAVTVAGAAEIQAPSAQTGVVAAPSAVSPAEAASLQFMREEEKLAHDVYVTLYEQWGLRLPGALPQARSDHPGLPQRARDRPGTGGMAMSEEDWSYLAAALVNAAFPVAVAVALGLPIVRSRNQRNYFFIGLLALLGVIELAKQATYNRQAENAAASTNQTRRFNGRSEISKTVQTIPPRMIPGIFSWVHIAASSSASTAYCQRRLSPHSCNAKTAQPKAAVTQISANRRAPPCCWR